MGESFVACFVGVFHLKYVIMPECRLLAIGCGFTIKSLLRCSNFIMFVKIVQSRKKIIHVSIFIKEKKI